ncbi:TolC family protein [Bacteroides sp. An322]|uniref:TolC family protein n=1 Tax=Bacteroides sp. An322 TaxID=1965632 RepID=UPI001EF6DF2F|nr:TolC family protein [Bacteroides sp. An322]
MRIKTITFFFALVSYAPCFAQLSIEACYEKARANYPLIKQYGLIEKTKEYNLSNAAKGYLPQVTFSAQATYQSDVTEIPIDLDAIGLTGVKIPSVSQDQYKMELALNQTLWDGGAIRSERKTLRTQAEVDQRDMDVSMYTINERVNQLYFGVLLAEAQLEQNKVLQAELRRSCEQVSSYIKNGIAQQSDLDAIRVDLLKAKQTEAQFEHTKRAYREMLSRLIGEEIGEETRLVKPEAVRPLTKENNRPELELYQAQIRNLRAQDSRITAGMMPKLGLFVTGGYGKPGLDMFEDNFKAYYLAGVRLSWNLGSLYTRKNDRRKIQTGIRSIETQRETFLFNTSLDVAQRNATIDKYIDQLKYDDEIIALRGSVKRASEAKMANGTLSGTDLTRDIHAEQSAIQDKILHEMELLQAIYNLKYVTNNK